MSESSGFDSNQSFGGSWVFPDAFWPLFPDAPTFKERVAKEYPHLENPNWIYYVITSGRMSGKTTNLAAYFVAQLLGPTYFRGVVARFSKATLKKGIYRDIQDFLEKSGLINYVTIAGEEIRCKYNRNMIFTHSFRMSDNTEQSRGKGIASATALIIDEAQDLPSEEQYIITVDSFRTKGARTQIFILMNPSTRYHWTFKRFWLTDRVPKPEYMHDHCFIHLTYHHVAEHLPQWKIDEMERKRITDPEYYDHHVLGNWSDGGEGRVYKNWIVDEVFEPDPEAEVTYGLDFGFSEHGSPSGCIEVHRSGKRLWLKEIFYERHLNVEEMVEIMKREGVPMNAELICDPGGGGDRIIEDLKKLGYRNAKLAKKGPNTVNYGIQKVKQFEVHVESGSENLLQEYNMYCWKKGTDNPVKAYDHLLDALRYAISLEAPSKTLSIASVSSLRRRNLDHF